MKNKALVIITAILFVLTCAAGIVGYIEHGKDTPDNPKPKPKKELIKYEYYLEDLLVDEMPVNKDMTKKEENTDTNETTTTDTEKKDTETKEYDLIQYEFSKYQCTNGVTGTFDTNEWKFIPSQEKESVCKLYFVNAFYSVELSAANGVVDEKNETKIKRESDGSFIVKPNEGYEFKEVTCTNNKQAKYDKSTNTLNISVIMENVACKVDFQIKALRLDLNVKNGQGSTTENTKYGESVSAIVEPNEGYENPKVECTNNQVAKIENNQLIIEKITDNTTCTVTFNKVQEKKYTLKVNVGEGATITSGSIEQQIIAGKDAKFSIKPEEGYEIKLNCGGIQPSETTTDPNGTINYTFLNMSQNITCNVTTTKTTTTPEQTGE